MLVSFIFSVHLMHFRQYGFFLWINIYCLMFIETKSGYCETIETFQLYYVILANIQCRKSINRRWNCLEKVKRTTHTYINELLELQAILFQLLPASQELTHTIFCEILKENVFTFIFYNSFLLKRILVIIVSCNRLHLILWKSSGCY